MSHRIERDPIEPQPAMRPDFSDVLAATVTYDPGRTSISALRAAVEECGYHCAGQSVPDHLCVPMEEPKAGVAAHAGHGAEERAGLRERILDLLLVLPSHADQQLHLRGARGHNAVHARP